VDTLQNLRQHGATWLHLTFAQVEKQSVTTNEIPKSHDDHLRHINQIHIALRRAQRMPIDIAFINLTRSKLKKRDDCQKWRQAEWAQHNKYKMQDMFGAPIRRSRGATVLPFVWIIKENQLTGEPIYKTRSTCNGSQ
jgi:hypothetical protein